MRKKEREIKYLSQKELKKFFDIIEKTKDNNKLYLRDLLIFNLMYYLALRVSEVGNLLFDDYNSLNNTIYIRRLKGSNNNTLKLDEKRLKILKKYIRDYNINTWYLLKTKNWWKLNRFAINSILKKYEKLSWIQLNTHIFKHSIWVHLWESWIDIKDLQYYLWHKDIKNTLIYFKYTTKQLDDMYKKLEKNNQLV